MAQKRSTKRKTIIDFVDTVTSLGLKLAAVVFLLASGYLIYGFSIKTGIQSLGKLPLADQQRVLSNVLTASVLVRISITVFAVCAIIRYYSEEMLGYSLAILGALLYFGAPWGFSLFFGQMDPGARKAVTLILVELRLLGEILLIPGMALIAWNVIARVRTSIAERRSKQALKAHKEAADEEEYRPRLYAKCWQTQYCHRFVRDFCPAYAARKSCWRIKSGCICDKNIIDKAMGVNSVEGVLLTGRLEYQTGCRPGKTASLSAAAKRERCRTCVVFEFHQKQKYKLLSPIVFPAVLLPIWLCYAKLEVLFRLLVNFTDRFMHVVAFQPQHPAALPQTSIPEFVPVLFVVWLSIMLVSYALLFVEFCVFRLRI